MPIGIHMWGLPYNIWMPLQDPMLCKALYERSVVLLVNILALALALVRILTGKLQAADVVIVVVVLVVLVVVIVVGGGVVITVVIAVVILVFAVDIRSR